MSQRDLVAELRTARVAAPLEVRERVRAIAASAAEPSPGRRFLRKRTLLVLVPVAAALAGTVILTRPAGHNRRHELALARPGVATIQRTGRAPSVPAAPPGVNHAAAGKSFGAALAPAPSPTRAQRYGAAIGLRVATPGAVSSAVKQALRITASLGGHPTSVHASSAAKSGTADLVLRIPRRHVQEAVTRLSQLGTITSEEVNVEDVQPTLDAADQRIARLQKQLAGLRAQPQTPERDRRIAAVTAQVERLQRNEAATLHSTQLATVRVHVETPARAAPVHHKHGPLHGLGIGAYWTGIGALYAAAFGLPLLALVALVYFGVRAVRRRRVDALLSRP
jgi:hypothetical protein